jgi:hypothetical protein
LRLAAHLCKSRKSYFSNFDIIFSGEDVDNWVGGKGDKGGDGGGKAVDYAEDAVMLQMEDDEIEAEAADDEEDSSGPSGYDKKTVARLLRNRIFAQRDICAPRHILFKSNVYFTQISILCKSPFYANLNFTQISF